MSELTTHEADAELNYLRDCITRQAQIIHDTKAELDQALATLQEANARGDRWCATATELDTDLQTALAVSRRLQAPELREELAALCHEQWTGWMRHLYSKAYTQGNGDFMVITKTWWTRWLRQMDTPYAQLSEREKDSDRKEADRILALFSAPNPTSSRNQTKPGIHLNESPAND